ncbi:hypothetical protein HLB44_35505 [Aquincola sp. S2]|uniref:Uncharacterized protein n=1 Tax=Pseudaquabacterium terrae TaxID=2732868 RepID=A0ABX2EUF0_9BURK|nr:hypothetical protein [Aquabacterium terrae]NRF72298.1 hypothetical protein [Aquabacterium terrae]
MTDLSANPPQGDFKGWSSTKTKAHIEASVPIINRWASFGVAVSVTAAELAALAPAAADTDSKVILGGLRTPYAVCCHLAMAAMRSLTRNADIAYFFEFGDGDQGDSAAFTNHIRSHRGMAQQLYGMRSYAILDAADSRLFEMADIYAWEWAKHVERDAAKFPIDEKGETRLRGSLRALLGDNLRKTSGTNIASRIRRGWHVTGPVLERYYARVAQFELLSDRPSSQALNWIEQAVATGELPPL